MIGISQKQYNDCYANDYWLQAGTHKQRMADLSLNPTDHAVLELLSEGRCTPSYIAQETAYSRGNVQNRLLRLTEHGYVQQLGGGLYELINDPRTDEND